MTKHSIVRLRKEGNEISASVNLLGIIITGTGDSLKDALQMLAESLDENEQPPWESDAESVA